MRHVEICRLKTLLVPLSLWVLTHISPVAKVMIYVNIGIRRAMIELGVCSPLG